MLLLVSCLVLPLVSCESEKPPETPLRPVRVMLVVASGGSRVRTFSGATRAGVESRLSFRVPGEVRRRAVKVGDHVQAGQLIAELDRTDYELQVQQAEAALAQAKASERKARADYDRIRQLYESENASRNDLDAARAAHESADAQVRSAGKQLELAQQQLYYTRLTAPVEGDVATVPVEVNENVQAGQTVAVLTAGGELEVRVAIPEVLISEITEGEPVEVTFDIMRGQAFGAVVTEVGVQPEGTATTYPVTVRLTSSDPGIRPGMAAEVAFRFTGSGRESILVPPVAVGEDRQGRFVFVVEPTGEEDVGVVHRRPVRVGSLTARGLEIVEGLEEGEILVTAGVSKLEDGLRVRRSGGPGAE
jgi:RND family efflux transporter MFP subunit